MPDGYRESGRGSLESADAGESAHGYLRRATANVASYAGAVEFPNAVNETRDVQARGVARAVEGRQNMSHADYTAADTGEVTDIETGLIVAQGNNEVATTTEALRIADGI
jgi:hypothetical protein